MRAATLLLLIAAGGAGCRDASEVRGVVHRAPPADGLEAGVSPEGARHVRTVVGLHDPESVRYDAEQDVFFVSNMAGFGSLKDDNGYIVRVRAAGAGPVEMFVEGGRGGVTLNAPKGMTIQGDTLWVTDIDVVRGFHRRTGAPVATIDFSAVAPVLLNDIAAGSDGTLRVTDTGIHMVYEGNIHVGGDRIFSVGPGHAVTTIAEGPHLYEPNGVVWDSTSQKWLVVSFNRFRGEIATMSAASDSARHVVRRGKGQLDGVEVTPGGRTVFSSWADSSIHVLLDGRDVRVIRQVPEPADIGLDTRRRRVLIPLTVLGQVQVWELAAEHW